jgi:hypothetical protein
MQINDLKVYACDFFQQAFTRKSLKIKELSADYIYKLFENETL